jgi:hypothetical protein
MMRVLSVAPTIIENSIRSFITYLREKNTNPAFKSELVFVINLPQWYLLLSKHQQAFLKHVINDADEIESVVSFLSSRHRTLPAPANFGGHSLLIITTDGKVTPLFKERYRSSHIASRDLVNIKAPEALMKRHCEANLAQVMRYSSTKQLKLFQTLISPISLAEYIPDVFETPPDYNLDKQANAALNSAEIELILSHNHPFNVYKRYAFTAADDIRSTTLIEKIEMIIKSIMKSERLIAQLELKISLSSTESSFEIDSMKASLNTLICNRPSYYLKTSEINRLLTDYKGVLNSSLGSATLYDFNGRELFLTSLEQLIILTLDGYSYGSCVSGKDRKAIELIHTDAMIIYKSTYQQWPQFNDKGSTRKRFISIVVDLYLSRHQQELAGQSAPGSTGIKTPSNYFPPDICEAIINARCDLGVTDYLVQDDRLASDNEVKNIFSSSYPSLIDEAGLKTRLVAGQLGDELCTELFDSLFKLINEKHLFKLPQLDTFARSLKMFSKNADSPTGIDAIRSIIFASNLGGSNVTSIAHIIKTVLDRPEEQNTRTSATTSIYTGIRGLCSPSIIQPYGSLPNYAEYLIKSWNEMFASSKMENKAGSEITLS